MSLPVHTGRAGDRHASRRVAGLRHRPLTAQGTTERNVGGRVAGIKRAKRPTEGDRRGIRNMGG
jgi:hypothetical protein